MSQFKLVSPFQPMGDQVQAIQELVQEKHLLLLMLSKNIINQRWF